MFSALQHEEAIFRALQSVTQASSSSKQLEEGTSALQARSPPPGVCTELVTRNDYAPSANLPGLCTFDSSAMRVLVCSERMEEGP